MTKYFIMGQTVYHIDAYRHILIGTITSTNHSEKYAIRVQFGTESLTFTEDGRKYSSDDVPSLFQKYPILTIVENKSIETFEDGELVLVRDSDDGQWQLKYYAKGGDGRYECYHHQSTTGQTTAWNQIQKYQSNSLLENSTKPKL